MDNDQEYTELRKDLKDYIRGNKEKIYTQARMNSINNTINLPFEKSWVRKQMILLTVSGSYSYGTNLETSDMDVKGVIIPTIDCYLGLEVFKDPVITTDDDVHLNIFQLNNFVKSAMMGTSNTIESLFTLPEHIIFINNFGEELLSHRDEFITHLLVQEYFLYFCGLKNQLHVNRSSQTQNYDTKIAYQALRTISIAEEILYTGTFNTFRKNNDWLKEIRQGKLTLTQILECIKFHEIDFKYLMYKKSKDLPEKPDYEKVNKWLIDLTKRAIL